jgi:thiamine-monophosphate kinase
VLGGNLTAANELSLTTTALGSAHVPLTRRGAHEGDRIYVTGRFGEPGEALRRLQINESPGPYRARFAHPTARLREGRWLAERGASAGIDVSDGLVADLRHLITASGLSAELNATLVPLVDGVSVERAIQSGEEYELLVSSPHELSTDEFVERFGLPLTEIGRVIRGDVGSVHIHGARVANAQGHDHLSR